MISKRLRKSIIIFVLALILSFSFVLSSAITYTYSKTNPPPGAQYSDSVPLWNGTGVPTAGQGIFTANGTIDNSVISDMPSKELQTRIRATMKVLTTAVANEESPTDGIAKSDYYDLLRVIQDRFNGDMSIIMLLSENYQADMVGAVQTMSGAQKTVNLLMGIIAWGVLLFTSFTTTLDLMFIFIPIMQIKATNGKDKPWYVSIEAFSAVKESHNSFGSGGSNVNFKYAIWIYLKRRWIAIAFLILALTLVTSSKFMTLIATKVYELISGVFGVI